MFKKYQPSIRHLQYLYGGKFKFFQFIYVLYTCLNTRRVILVVCDIWILLPSFVFGLCSVTTVVSLLSCFLSFNLAVRFRLWRLPYHSFFLATDMLSSKRRSLLVSVALLWRLIFFLFSGRKTSGILVGLLGSWVSAPSRDGLNVINGRPSGWNTQGGCLLRIAIANTVNSPYTL